MGSGVKFHAAFDISPKTQWMARGLQNKQTNLYVPDYTHDFSLFQIVNDECQPWKTCYCDCFPTTGSRAHHRIRYHDFWPSDPYLCFLCMTLAADCHRKCVEPTLSQRHDIPICLTDIAALVFSTDLTPRESHRRVHIYLKNDQANSVVA